MGRWRSRRLMRRRPKEKDRGLLSAQLHPADEEPYRLHPRRIRAELRREIRLYQRFQAFTARRVALSIEQSRSTMKPASRQR